MLDVKPFSQRERRYRELLTRGQRRNRDEEAKAEDIIRRIREDGGQGLLSCVREYEAAGVAAKNSVQHGGLGCQLLLLAAALNLRIGMDFVN